MFTNRKLYTLNPDAYEGSVINQEQLIVNRIDIDFLSHVIFFPSEFLFDPYYLIDVKKMTQNPTMRNTLREELKNKKCSVILGFKDALFDRCVFKESDIALETSMLGVL